MAFQPFGFPFRIDSPLQLSDLKAAIRARKRPIFDMPDGPRGWIVGPLICLWFSLYDRHGPMLLGWMSRNHSGTRVVGRAGSDLNGLLLVIALTPVLAFIIFGMATSGDYPVGRVVIVAALYILICGAVLWSKHMFRRDAEPLVRFLQDVAIKRSSPGKVKGTDQARLPTMTLTAGDRVHEGILTPEMIRTALLDLGPDGFAIAESAPQTYLQTAWQDGDFIIEKREGDRSRHYSALNMRGQSGASGGSGSVFSFEEVTLVFTAYLTGAPLPSFVNWTAIRV